MDAMHFLGGIAANYGTNFWSSERNVSVIEADEYDRSFLKLSPDIAVITAMDADHLDIYGDEKTLADAFVAFGSKVKEGGLLIGRFGLSRLKESGVKRRWTYSLQNNAADVYASNVKIEEGGYRFDVHLKDRIIADCSLRIGGMHNVENTIVAIAIASELQIEDDKIKAALAVFKGVKRRFEYIIPANNISGSTFVQPVLVDDYAHHPEELRALLTSVGRCFRNG
jgi:UDP-N-acetylmuramate--alanine ligase